MHRDLMDVLCCPFCHGELRLTAASDGPDVDNGILSCPPCARDFKVEGGIGILGDQEQMTLLADRWPAGLSDDKLRQAITERQQEYQTERVFRDWVDAAAQTEGTVVDIATGPASSLLGALVPLLSERTHLIITDASLYLLPRLQRIWRGQSSRARMDFLALDGNRMPFRDGVLDAMTSRLGFGCVWDDPERKRPPRFGHAYREAQRTLKPGGRIFELCLFFAPGSQTAAYLDKEGCINSSQERLEAFWASLGFAIESSRRLWPGTGKSDPGDLVPVAKEDEWWHVAYVLLR